MPIDENAAWQQLRPGHRRADTVSAPVAGVLDRRSTSRAARNYVSTDLKGVAMKASAISLMGVRGATPAAPSPRRAVIDKQFPLRLGHSTSTDGAMRPSPA